jgi:hypothetical protein
MSMRPFPLLAARALCLAGALAGAWAMAQDTLANGATLAKGHGLTSSNGEYQMDFREDGKLAVYRIASASPARTLCWQTPGDGFMGPGTLEVQGDNDLVIRDGDREVRWHTGTGGQDPESKAALVMGDDGELCLQGGRRVWGSASPGPAVTVRIILPREELREAVREAQAEADKCVVQ